MKPFLILYASFAAGAMLLAQAADMTPEIAENHAGLAALSTNS